MQEQATHNLTTTSSQINQPSMSREISHNIALAAGFGNEVPLPNDADNDMKMSVSMY